ncbi:hypothetical protein IHE45_06G021100 [Dioscorea alata]|uniref:Uncharacterized protein n=1 Tax=Dioscorea alata TaxID=55571 RepID=A0ACB7VVV1_DIOAL|nr:hypothetical protein IHE45_06G021100 [Dioscorea alata]
MGCGGSKDVGVAGNPVSYRRILTKKTDDPKSQESQEFSTTFEKLEAKQVDEKTEKIPMMVEVVEEGKKEIKELPEKKLEYNLTEREVGKEGEKIEESKEESSVVGLGAGDELLKGESDEKGEQVSEVEKIEESKEENGGGGGVVVFRDESLKDETDEKGEQISEVEKIEESKEENCGSDVLAGEECLKDETSEKGEHVSEVEKIEDTKEETGGGFSKGEEAFNSKVEKIEESKEENGGGGIPGEETLKGESDEKGKQVSAKDEKGEISPKEEDGKHMLI